ncbi:MAG: glycosyltransferase [Nitrospirae bacterium]|nr:glycosyltransferase [Nitrospirota bacterium]
MTVVLPTYNERDNVAPLIEACLAALEKDADVVVVDDDSPDGTGGVVAAICEKDPRVRLVRRMRGPGLASAIRDGVEAARGDLVAWMDCDFSMPPSLLPEMRKALDSVDIVVGSRYVGAAADRRDDRRAVLGSRVINAFARFLLGGGVTDYTSGFVAARKDAVTTLGIRDGYGEYCIDLLARAGKSGFRIAEVPYTCAPRASGESKTATSWSGYLRRGWPYVKTIFQAWRGDGREARLAR